jgi:hypothetical protein
MVLTDRFTGSRRSRDRRMAASRERSGNMLPVTSVTGRTTRRTDSVFTSTRMEISMKASGREISAMVKEPTGEMREANSVVNILEIGSRTRSMAEVLSSTKTVIAMTATGWLACLREREE